MRVNTLLLGGYCTDWFRWLRPLSSLVKGYWPCFSIRKINYCVKMPSNWFLLCGYCNSSGKVYYVYHWAEQKALPSIFSAGVARCSISALRWISSKTETDHKNPDWKHSIFFPPLAQWIFSSGILRNARISIKLLSLRSSFFLFFSKFSTQASP